MPKIYLIGAGPGKDVLFTEQALSVLDEVDTVLGNGRLCHRIESMLAGKAVFTVKPQHEHQLASKAVDFAEKGEDVVLLMEGDPGQHQLAGHLAKICVEKEDISVELIPGIPDFISAASIIGTPLAGGFVSIRLNIDGKSLEEVGYQLKIAAQNDLTVVVFYPDEKSSPELLRDTLQTFRESRLPDSLVAVVRRPYRSNQEVKICRLEVFDPATVVEAAFVFFCADGCRQIADNWISS
ncbi:hypothetical protein KAH55_00450 [bacterium]|nr:hypothetical protein [bacterium]